ncbi:MULTISPECIES: hypothetical protein [unclassified Streptomyces]|uniref:hypothetical protein n=1 Tax=unclassified Streptomyces TaxID=2593676 RepID=UPI0035DC1FEE
MEREPSLPAPQAVRVIRPPRPRLRAVGVLTTTIPLFPPLFAALCFLYARERGGAVLLRTARAAERSPAALVRPEP